MKSLSLNVHKVTTPPAAIAAVTDVQHALQVHETAREILPTCEPLHSALQTWSSQGSGFLIALIRLDATTPIRMFIAGGRGALRRRTANACSSLKGSKCAWVFGLADQDVRLVELALAEVATTITTAVSLADIQPQGNA